MNKYFDISRFWLLLKMELYRSRKGIGMTLVIIYGISFFIDLILSNIIDDSQILYEFYGNYAFTLIAGGFILSSLSFQDLSNTLKRYQYLTLPASTFEKFLSMWLLTTVGWIVIYTLLFTVYSMIALPVGRFLFPNMTFIPFHPASNLAVTVMKYYFVTQGIFLVGATHFKGYVLPKTLFTLVIVAIVCAAIAYFILDGAIDGEGEDYLSTPGVLESMPVYKVWLVIKWLFWWTLAPICWVVTYFGLKEKEV